MSLEHTHKSTNASGGGCSVKGAKYKKEMSRFD